jgi:hypothetical protein
MITLQTEAGSRFYTFGADREIEAKRVIDGTGRQITFGPLMAAKHAFAVAGNETSRAVVVAHDRSGDQLAGTINTNHTRFFFNRPTFRITGHVTAENPQWRQIATGMRLSFTLMHGNARSSPSALPGTMRLSFSRRHLGSAASKITSLRGGKVVGDLKHSFDPGSRGAFSTGRTKELSFDLAWQPVSYRNYSYPHGSALWVRITLSISGLGSTINRRLAESLTFSGGTLR